MKNSGHDLVSEMMSATVTLYLMWHKSQNTSQVIAGQDQTQ